MSAYTCREPGIVSIVMEALTRGVRIELILNVDEAQGNLNTERGVDHLWDLTDARRQEFVPSRSALVPHEPWQISGPALRCDRLDKASEVRDLNMLRSSACR